MKIHSSYAMICITNIRKMFTRDERKYIKSLQLYKHIYCKRLKGQEAKTISCSLRWQMTLNDCFLQPIRAGSQGALLISPTNVFNKLKSSKVSALNWRASSTPS